MSNTKSTKVYKEMELVFNKQRDSFLEEGFPSLETRTNRLNRMLSMIIKYQDEINETLTADYGTRTEYINYAVDIVNPIGTYAHVLKELPKWIQGEIATLEPWTASAGVKAKIMYDPLGVVGIIAPWNFPIEASLSPLAFALAAGNRALIKPSSKTPKTAELIKKMVEEVFDPTEVAVFTGTGEVNDAFNSLPFDKIMLTGSPKVGKKLLGAISENLVPALLELGGKNPVIIADDADLDNAVKMIWGAKLANSGQICLNADHVYIPAGKEEEFIKKSKVLVSRWYPTVKDNKYYTSIINEENYRRLLGYLDEAKENGVRVERMTNPNEELSTKYRQIPPYVIVNPPVSLGVMKDEIFGPILPIITYSSLDKVVDKVNSGPSPLGLYYFGTNEKSINFVVEHTHSGGVTINNIVMHSSDPALPFGGVGNSGMGKYHGFHGFEAFCNKKPIYYESIHNPNSGGLHPPYQQKLGFLKAMAVPKP